MDRDVLELDERLRTILDLVDGKNILDVGCVNHSASQRNVPNWLHGHLVRRFPSVLGVDIAADEVEALKKDGYNVVVADVEEMRLSVRFDCIVAGDIIEHLSNPGRFLDRCREHLEPSGKLVISSPNPFHLRNIVRTLLGNLEPHVNSGHVAWYDPFMLGNLAERHGFRVEQVLFINYVNLEVPPSLLKFALKAAEFVLPKRIGKNTFVCRLVRV